MDEVQGGDGLVGWLGIYVYILHTPLRGKSVSTCQEM